MNREEQFKRVQYLIHYGIKRDADAMDRILNDIVDHCDNVGELYGICYYLGVYGGRALRELYDKEHETEGFFGLDQNYLTDKDTAEIFALRFVTTCANDDRETALALFTSAYNASNEETGLSLSARTVYVSNLEGEVNEKKKVEAQ